MIHRNGNSNGNGRKRRRLPGFLGKLDEVIIADFLGELGWMVVLLVSVLAVIGLVYAFTYAG